MSTNRFVGDEDDIQFADELTPERRESLGLDEAYARAVKRQQDLHPDNTLSESGFRRIANDTENLNG
jgi:hypothetical protein